MKKRSVFSVSSVIWVIIGLAIVIGGYKFFYPNHVTNTESAADKQSSAKVIEIEESNSVASKSQDSDSADKAETTKGKIWTSAQDKELATFITEWSQTMGQSYTGTNDSSNVNFNGVSFPDIISNGTITVNGAKVSMKWTKNKAGDSDYKVVAVYAGAAYVYLFTFHDDEPEVLVTSQATTSGANFMVTENAQLVSGFEKIANGNSDE